MDLEKFHTIVNYQTPIFVCDVQCFLGFTNFYHIFIKDYSKDCYHIDMTYKQGQIQMG